MIMELRDNWTSWHKRFKTALDSHKEATGQTDADLAAAAEASRASITHWKVGRRTPQLKNFFLACQAIGADPAYVLFGRSFQAANEVADRISKLPPKHLDAVMTALDGAELRAAKEIMHEHPRVTKTKVQR